MAKQKVQNYVFLPGVAKSSNAYPNAYSLISNNKEFIKAEVVAYINAQVAADNASNLYPNAVTLLTNNKTFITDEIVAYINTRVSSSTAPFVGYTYVAATLRSDVGALVDAVIYDVRYGGNEKTIEIAKSFWQGGVAKYTNVTPDAAIFSQVFTIITNFILPKTAYTSQQSPITSTQNTTGAAAEAGVAASITNNLSLIISNAIASGLSTLPAISYSARNYAGYIFDSSKCNRDVGYVIDAYLNDLRYGGNAQTRYVSSRFWDGTTPQLSGDRKPEITAEAWIRDLIVNTLLPQTSYPTPYQLVVPRYVNGSISAEAGSTTRITTLANSFIAVLTNGLTSLPTLVNGVTTIRLQGKYDLDRLLLITNTTNNTILYNFADATHVASVDLSTGYVSNDYWQDDDFQSFRNITDWITTITFDIDTSTANRTDKIQILVEEKEMKVRPYDFGTDAIERHRMAMPQSMLDADFEYGLQPTKWQAIGLQRGYPSVYEVPGTETPVTNVTTDASTGTSGVGQSLITVTTTGPHGFSVGTPFTIKSLANSISGFSRAEGTFIVNTVPSTTTFTYYSQSKVGTSNGQVLATTYTQLRRAEYYTGASLGTPSFAVASNGSNVTLTSKFSTAAGSDQIAYTAASVPSIGSTLTGTGMGSGAQVTGAVGTGGAAITATLETETTIGDTIVTLSSTSGILEGLAIDNGSGAALFVTSIIGNTVSLTGQLTSVRRGSTKTYTNISGTNLNPSGIGAEFSVQRSAGNYSNVTPTVAGSNYVVGDRILIPGTSLGGTSPVNDLTVTVNTVDGLGGIASLGFAGTSVSGNANYTAIQQTTTSGSGVLASFDIIRTNGTYAVSINVAGNGYINGETITISGVTLGGTSPTNDLTINVTSVGGAGDITGFTFSGTAFYDATFSGVTGTNVLPIGTGATFNVIRTGGGYTVTIGAQAGTNYFLGEKIRIPGTSLDGASPANDATISITSVSGNAITGATISGTGVLGETVEFWSSVSFSEVTTATVANNTSITATGIATIQVTFPNAHGLVPGQSIIVTINSTGTNHNLAQGPFFIESVSNSTTFRYSARTVGNVSTADALTGTVYTRSDAYFVHRPFDGGVQLGTGGPQHGAQAIRMSKKYVRYQSGKGINYNTGALFAPSFNVQSVSATGTSIGSFITIVTDDVDHGCQVGGVIRLSGIETKGYNNEYTVADVVNERQLRVQAVSVLANTNATLTANSQISLVRWHGATVRAGTFDEQNGLFMQYNGQEFAVGRRSSTFQIAGTISITRDTNLVTGTNTRFRDQIKAGDKVVIRGMTHVVTNVTSQTSMTVNPDYRGASNATNAKICLIQDFIIPQSEFNLDKLDGTGPSGYNLDVSKMQMIGMQWSWYAVGFIDFMMRGSDGNFVFFHRIRNSNVNTEAYMRTGNQPVRYEVINEGARGKLLESITANQTTIPLADARDFPNESAIVMIDNELISYTAKNGNTLTGCTRAAPMTNFVGGSQRTFSGSVASTHEFNTGVVLVSNTVSPIISHWGSAVLTDGLFDEDRGYIFSYAATNISVSTTKQTAFLIRLAPSVSNAIIGDLGDRELINRAQLLLKGIEITSDTGTGGIVVEGVLNPQNYPANPSAIAWGGLASSGAGGQPSFAQIAPGGSVSWTTGATQTTATATSIAFPTGTITTRALSWRSNRSLESGQNWFVLTETDYNSYVSQGFAIGDSVSGTGIPANTTISNAFFWYTDGTLGRIWQIQMNQNANQNVTGNGTLTVTKRYQLQNTSVIFFTTATWNASGATTGTEVSDVLFPANTFVTAVTSTAYFGTNYVRAQFSQTSTSSSITAGTTTITFKFGQPPYGLPGETVFSFVAAPGGTVSLDLSELKELTNTTLGGRGTYPNGPDVLAINVYKSSGTATPANIVLRWGEAQA